MFLRNRYLGLCLLVILLGFVLRVRDLSSFPVGLSNDEAVNVVDALHIAQVWRFPFYEDFGRPEPLYRWILAFGQALFGPGVWSARLTSALIGVVTLACAYWAAPQLLHDQAPTVRFGAALVACSFLAVGMGHITLSRALYRGLLQMPIMFMGIGLVLRALRTRRPVYFAQAGLMVGLGFYTYTAYFFVPLAFVPLALTLPLAHRHRWRSDWLGLGFGLTAVVVLLIIAPIALRFLQTPQAVIGRSGATAAAALDPFDSARVLIDQIWNAGDENPQYNVAQAPIAAPAFVPLLLLGLAALLWRWRQPSSAMLAALLILTSLPALLSDEVNHGLRTLGLAASLALLAALGAALALHSLKERWARLLPLVWVAGMMIVTPQAWQVYADYWLQADRWPLWRVHGRELNHNEWFFRTDHRELATWIGQQAEPLLLPVEALNQPTLRAWLARAYPLVSAGEPAPDNIGSARIVLPYSLERDSFMPTAPHYALLHDGQITILPPFDRAAQAQIAQAAETAEAVRGAGRISPIAHVMTALPELAYQDLQPVQISYAHPLRLTAWAGENWPQDGVFSAAWQADSTLAHDYFTYLQILNQEYQVIAQAQDAQALRWLYPSTLWPVGQPIPVPYVVPLPSLEAGAYRLVIGAYPIFQPPLKAVIDGQSALFPQVCWLKVAHPPIAVPEAALRLNAVFDGTLELLAADVRQEGETLQVDLFWQSLIGRPSLDATVFVHALDAEQNIIAQQDARPQDGRYPTFIWDQGEVVRTSHQLEVQAVDSLRIGLYEFVAGVPRNLPTDQGEALLLDLNLWR